MNRVHLRIVFGVELCRRLAFVDSRVRVSVRVRITFWVRVECIRVRLSVEIDD